MVNERDNPNMFKNAHYFGHQYLEDFQVILWKDRISVIEIGISQKCERIDIHRHFNRWFFSDGRIEVGENLHCGN